MNRPLRFNAATSEELPKGWVTRQIRELGTVVTGKTPSTKNPEYWNGDIPFITPSDLQGTAIRHVERSISEAGLKILKPLPKGSVLVSCIGYIGKVGIVEHEPAVTNQQINAVIPNEQADGWFLTYLFQYLQPLFEDHASMTTVPILNKGNFEVLPIPLPPLTEQKTIAHVIRTVQQAKEATEKVIAATRQLKQSLMKHLFTYGPVPFDQADRLELKETEIGSLPSHWGTARLGFHATHVTKGSSPKWQGFEYSNDGIAFIRSQNVGWGRLELSDLARLPETFNTKHRSSIVQQGDLLVNLVGASIGRAAVADQSVDGANSNQAVSIVRLKETLDANFAMAFLLTKCGQEQIHRQKKEIARANLSLQDVRNFVIPVAPLKEQREIVGLLMKADAKLAAEENRARTLDAVVACLLHHLLTGKVRVPIETDRVAAEAV